MSYLQSFHRLIETEDKTQDIYYVIVIHAYFSDYQKQKNFLGSCCIFLMHLRYSFHVESYMHRFGLIHLVILLNFFIFF